MGGGGSLSQDIVHFKDNYPCTVPLPISYFWFWYFSKPLDFYHFKSKLKMEFLPTIYGVKQRMIYNNLVSQSHAPPLHYTSEKQCKNVRYLLTCILYTLKIPYFGHVIHLNKKIHHRSVPSFDHPVKSSLTSVVVLGFVQIYYKFKEEKKKV